VATYHTGPRTFAFSVSLKDVIAALLAPYINRAFQISEWFHVFLSEEILKQQLDLIPASHFRHMAIIPYELLNIMTTNPSKL
jgi:hypothetical protein